MKSFGFIEVVEIGALPKEGLAGGVLDAGGIDLVGIKDSLLAGAEIFANDGDHAHIGEEARGRAKSKWLRPRDSALCALRVFRQCQKRRCPQQ